MFLLLTSAFAQNRNVESLLSKYKDKEGIKVVSMSDPGVFIAERESAQNAEAVKSILDGIKTIKTISFKTTGAKSNEVGKNFSVELEKFNPGDGFSEIMSLTEGKSKIKSLIRKNGDKVSEFIMIVAGESESTLIWLNGDINLKNVREIGKILKNFK